jgi:glucokinase
MTSCPVLEIGGTHVLASRIDPTTWILVTGSRHRMSVDSGGSAEAIIATMVSCADSLGLMSSETLTVAIPGPMDYANGVGQFRDVGKFDALAGVDLRQALLARLTAPPARIIFLNDADAFGLGEWVAGAARGYARVVAITLGTGVGSAFLDAGTVVSSGPTVPPNGDVHRLFINGCPLEQAVSNRAIVASYASLESDPAVGGDAGGLDEGGIDAGGVAALALRGDEGASAVFSTAFCLLGAALAPWLASFGAKVLVVGGGLTASWPMIDGPLRRGLGSLAGQVAVVKSPDSDLAAAVGAAWYGRRALQNPDV